MPGPDELLTSASLGVSVLLLLQGERPEDHPGVIDGFDRLVASRKLAHVEVMPLFGPSGTRQGPAFWERVRQRALDHAATIVIFQHYHSLTLPDPGNAIERLKKLPSRPVIVTTCGDAVMNGYGGRPNPPPSFLASARASDLVALTSMGRLADSLQKWTTAPIVLLPNGICQVRFRPPQPSDLAAEREFDVAFIGSRNAARNPFRPYARAARQREALVRALARRFGRRFAVFGNGWGDLPAARGPIPFAEQHAAARRARVLVGGIPFSRARYYLSDRVFTQIGSGVPFVDTVVGGVDAILSPGEHWLLAPPDRLVRAVESLLDETDATLQARGSAAAHHIFGHHTQAHRMETLVENALRIRDHRESGTIRGPYMPFLLPEVDQAREVPLATRSWPA